MSEWESLFEQASGEKDQISGNVVIDSFSSKKKYEAKDDEKDDLLLNPTLDDRMRLPSSRCLWGKFGLTKLPQDRNIRSPCRNTSPYSVLNYIQLGPSLRGFSKNSPFTCTKWAEIPQKKSKQFEATAIGERIRKTVRTCQNCDKSTLSHQIIPTLTTNTTNKNIRYQGTNFDFELVNLFVAIRNIRASISFFDAQASYDSKNALRIDELISLAKSIYQYSLSCSSIFNTLSTLNSMAQQELSLLIEKSTNLQDAVKKLQKELRNKKKHISLEIGYTLMQHKIQITVAVDALYFRTYYLSSNGFFKILFSTQIIFPSPSAYFGSKNLAWDVVSGEQAWEEMSHFIEEKTKNHAIYLNLDEKKRQDTLTTVKRWIENKFGMKLMLKKGQSNKCQEVNTSSTKTKGMDPLSYLHRNRMLETILLFWKQFQFQLCPNAHKDMFRALQQYHVDTKKDYNCKINIKKMQEEELLRHETPAPFVMKIWRDSCRDHLCTLYAYATIMPKTYNHFLMKAIRDMEIGKIVEVGAGTGYIASMLQKHGIEVIPLDIKPINSPLYPKSSWDSSIFNEYHGNTPSYCHVQSGDQQSINQFFISSTKSNKECPANIALMLCYPPPSPSNMSFDYLKKFISIGGKHFIYIGEFHGLTANPAFESVLKQYFDCLHRMPCLSWGSDTAELTIWKRRANFKTSFSSQSSSPICVQCSNCEEKNAVYRCIRARPLVYCSKDCFKNHTIIRKVHFTLQMIPHYWNKDIEFEDEREFVELTQLNKISRDCVSTTKRSVDESVSKRKKKRKKTTK